MAVSRCVLVEAGFYLSFAVDSTGQFLSDGAKIRSLFVVPDAATRDFFYGVYVRVVAIRRRPRSLCF